ncbi:sensor histidine kinase [Metabacillus idriensis]|uniref:sensor histidine kinase n=1 Tax=Metabacillus idriensis TaxID=324768 RepID=UPI00174E4565|nr:HAMP domain-containing sensor histidine kinase [Metabacillus idriensis]
MTITKKLIKQFILQFVLILFLIMGILVTGLFLLAYELSETDMNADFAKTSKEYLQDLIYKNESGDLTLKEHAKDTIRRQQGWFGIVDEKNQFLFSLDVPNDMKDIITKKPLSYITTNPRIPHQIEYWNISTDGEPKTVIFGRENLSIEILNQAVEHVDWNNHSIPSVVLDSFELSNASIYFFDKDNQIINSYNRNTKRRLTNTSILFSQKEPWNYKDLAASYYHESTGETLIVTTPNNYYNPDSLSGQAVNKVVIQKIFLTLTILFCILLLLSFLLAKKFGLPILHIMKWLENLSKSNFTEPANKKGVPSSMNRKGVLKKGYRIFGEVIASLNTLTQSLKDNLVQLKKNEKTREEWISGLSHDLKTPLSTLYGYSVMLESDQYEWSHDDIKGMAGIMKKKAEYMSGLIEDLNLTYRLKNNDIPIDKTIHNVGCSINEVLEDFKSNIISKGYKINFKDSKETISFNLNKMWFKRILDNLLANSVKHNPSGTNILVSLNYLSAKSFEIIISDNGIGMDSVTVENLFNRYYRGTNTEEFETGTGLGLAITKELVIRHNGDILVESSPGKGSKIILRFEREY